MKKEQKILIDVIDMEIVGRDIAWAASCSGFDTCKEGLLLAACRTSEGGRRTFMGFRK